MMKAMIRLEDDTCGTVWDIEKEPEIGETVTVSLRDENGNLLEATGKVAEVLDSIGY
jgi:hypothetical protein